MEITGRLLRIGALWTYSGNFATVAFNFVVGIVLARLLGPAEFGTFMAVTAFTSVLLVLAQFGLPAAILQAKELTDEQANGAFWSVTLLGIIFFALLVLASAPLAKIYESADYQYLMILMGLVFLIIPFNAIGLALMRRAMKFDKVAIMGVITTAVVGPVEIVAALFGAGAYSLWLGTIVGLVISNAIIRKNVTWRPTWPTFSPVRTLLGYSGFSTVNQALSFLTGRVDNMLVGALLGTSILGLYGRAYSLARMPSNEFALSLGPLIMGSMSRIQDDTVRSRELYFKALCAIATASMPFLVFVLIAGPLAISFLYGERWSDAGQPLQIMVPGAAFLLVTLTLRSAARAQALVRESVPIHLTELIITGLGMLVLFPLGILGIAWAITIREVISLVLFTRLMERSRLQLRRNEIAFALAPSFIGVVVSCAAGVCALNRSAATWNAEFVLLFSAAAAVFLSYGAMIALLMFIWRDHQYLQAVRSLVADSAWDLAGRVWSIRKD